MKRRFLKAYTGLKHEYVTNPTAFALRVTVLLLAIALLVVERSIWTPDTLLIIVLVIGVVFGRAREFVVRFVPFLGALLAYDSLRSLADKINTHVNYTPMITFDKWIGGGQLPTQWLQEHLWYGHVTWYDFYFYGLYTIHFLAPVIIAFILWKYRPKLYWPFVWAFVIVSFAAFFTFIIFPAAPPWLAHQIGYFTGDFTRISSDIWRAMGINDFSTIYNHLSPNEVAAVPSLHCAYPTLAALFILKGFGWRRTWWITIYPLSMYVGVVYIGEHYVVDVLVGILYAVLAFYAANSFFAWYRRPGRRLQRAISHLLIRLHLTA